MLSKNPSLVFLFCPVSSRDNVWIMLHDSFWIRHHQSAGASLNERLPERQEFSLNFLTTLLVATLQQLLWGLLYPVLCGVTPITPTYKVFHSLPIGPFLPMTGPFTPVSPLPLAVQGVFGGGLSRLCLQESYPLYWWFYVTIICVLRMQSRGAFRKAVCLFHWLAVSATCRWVYILSAKKVTSRQCAIEIRNLNGITRSWFWLCLWKNHRMSFENIVWQQSC